MEVKARGLCIEMVAAAATFGSRPPRLLSSVDLPVRRRPTSTRPELALAAWSCSSRSISRPRRGR